jgi:hypothetical protein
VETSQFRFSFAPYLCTIWRQGFLDPSELTFFPPPFLVLFSVYSRVLCLWLDLTTSHGAKALMVLPQGQLLTTSKELDLLSGKPTMLLYYLLDVWILHTAS